MTAPTGARIRNKLLGERISDLCKTHLLAEEEPITPANDVTGGVQSQASSLAPEAMVIPYLMVDLPLLLLSFTTYSLLSRKTDTLECMQSNPINFNQK